MWDQRRSNRQGQATAKLDRNLQREVARIRSCAIWPGASADGLTSATGDLR